MSTGGYIFLMDKDSLCRFGYIGMTGIFVDMDSWRN